MYTFHIFLITIFFSPHMSLKKSLNLNCNVPKSLLFKVNSVGNPAAKDDSEARALKNFRDFEGGGRIKM